MNFRPPQSPQKSSANSYITERSVTKVSAETLRFYSTSKLENYKCACQAFAVEQLDQFLRD